jgi:hypothetical protein
VIHGVLRFLIPVQSVMANFLTKLLCKFGVFVRVTADDVDQSYVLKLGH